MFNAALHGSQILVVDDLPENAKILASFLTPQGYVVESVSNGQTALNFIDNHVPEAILLDLMMPGMDGYEVCRRLKQNPKTRHIPIIIITDLGECEANVKAMAAGADDFLTKPFDRLLLLARIENSIKSKLLHDQLLEQQQALEQMVLKRTEQVEVTQRITFLSLAKLAESRDNETGDHLERIRCYALELAEALASDPEYRHVIDDVFIKQLYNSSPLHDIGKVGIPDKILLKPGKLTLREIEVMKKHTLIGGDTLHVVDLEAGENSFLKMGRDIAYFHHERMDGRGYPFGLQGKMIPLAARITTLADAYDALTSRRPYKEPYNHEETKAIIRAAKGSQFDPKVVEAFLARERQFIEIRNHFHSADRSAPLKMLSQIAEEAPSSCSSIPASPESRIWNKLNPVPSVTALARRPWALHEA